VVGRSGGIAWRPPPFLRWRPGRTGVRAGGSRAVAEGTVVGASGCGARARGKERASRREGGAGSGGAGDDGGGEGAGRPQPVPVPECCRAAGGVGKCEQRGHTECGDGRWTDTSAGAGQAGGMKRDGRGTGGLELVWKSRRPTLPPDLLAVRPLTVSPVWSTPTAWQWHSTSRASGQPGAIQ